MPNIGIDIAAALRTMSKRMVNAQVDLTSSVTAPVALGPVLVVSRLSKMLGMCHCQSVSFVFAFWLNVAGVG